MAEPAAEAEENEVMMEGLRSTHLDHIGDVEAFACHNLISYVGAVVSGPTVLRFHSRCTC